MDNAKANQDKEMIALLGSHLGFKEMSQIVSTAENVNDDFDGRGCTKLFYMCSVGKLNEVQNLLKIKGVSLQKPNFDGNFLKNHFIFSPSISSHPHHTTPHSNSTY